MNKFVGKGRTVSNGVVGAVDERVLQLQRAPAANPGIARGVSPCAARFRIHRKQEMTVVKQHIEQATRRIDVTTIGSVYVLN